MFSSRKLYSELNPNAADSADYNSWISNVTLYLCFRQKLIQFWMVSLLEVSLVPDRVGGSPLSLKQPKFPGTAERREETKKVSNTT